MERCKNSALMCHSLSQWNGEFVVWTNNKRIISRETHRPRRPAVRSCRRSGCPLNWPVRCLPRQSHCENIFSYASLFLSLKNEQRVVFANGNIGSRHKYTANVDRNIHFYGKKDDGRTKTTEHKINIFFIL